VPTVNYHRRRDQDFAQQCAGAGAPDRADAMVWAMTEIMLAPVPAEPRIRRL
jgi:phage terminase large subunit-like protein